MAALLQKGTAGAPILPASFLEVLMRRCIPMSFRSMPRQFPPAAATITTLTVRDSRLIQAAASAVLVLSAAVIGCEGNPEVIMNNDHAGDKPRAIPIPLPRLSNAEVLRDLEARNEDPGDARKRIIDEILQIRPDFDPSLIEILRGPPGGIMLSTLSSADAPIAALVGQALQMREIEFDEHPERFVNTDEPAAELKARLKNRRLGLEK